ncbi:hypothetical protein M0Q50_01160 [bacterium]|jgi:hypothetical protein|nr:hypothetical protein [bacterium]
MWEDDDDNIEDFFDDDKWIVKINNEIESFDSKYESIECILNYLEDMFDNFLLDIKKLSIDDVDTVDDMYDYLLTCDVRTFYDTISIIIKYFKCNFSIKLINMDGEEPEFREL